MLVLSLKIATRYRYNFFCFRKKNESAYLKNKISSKIIRKIKYERVIIFLLSFDLVGFLK